MKDRLTDYSIKGLSEFEKFVLFDKGTEPAFSGEYLYNTRKGIYTCRVCGAPMYRSEDKFDSSCGWPSFDDEIPGAVRRSPVVDGERMEIMCSRCGAHMGHVFTGEGYTPKDVRHCVNSISMVFVPSDPQAREERRKQTALFAGGCFRDVEYMMKDEYGVIYTQTGYMGGVVRHPSYEQVASGTTGHYLVVKVVYDPAMTDYEKLARRFFEIHDPTQKDGQGTYKGERYRSVIFYFTPEQKATAEKLIDELRDNGYDVATEVMETTPFWTADAENQNYHERMNSKPDHHVYTKRFR